MPKISIVTVVYNGVATIQATIQSVLNQDHPDIEYIIVDGGSNDGTIDIIKSYENQIHKYISEKDNGIYDAMNKGIDMASGNVIGILNSDDLYFDSGTVSKVMQLMNEKKVDILYGDLIYFRSKDENKIARYYKGNLFSESQVSKGWVPPHPTFFIKKHIYEKYGKFNTQYTLSADFDLIVRFLSRYKVPYYYLPEVLVKMRLGGESTNSIKNIIKMNFDNLKSCKQNNIKTNFIKFHLKYISKTWQYIRNSI
ncbi:MAG: glycosyltransferase family 2 protein [Bacteroidota bacterium]